MELLTLLRLTSISSPSFFLLVPAHARAQCDVNTWRHWKAKRLRYLHKVQFIDVEDRP